jgi:hypothetical protein
MTRHGRYRRILTRLMLTTALLVAIGCGEEEPLRGAGSIDVPRGAATIPLKSPARRGKTTTTSVADRPTR